MLGTDNKVLTDELTHRSSNSAATPLVKMHNYNSTLALVLRAKQQVKLKYQLQIAKQELKPEASQSTDNGS